MHEMSVALAVVEQVEEAARAAGAAGVRQVRLQVGELAGVVPDALHFCFELACAGTLLEGAELVAEPVSARARCDACGAEWATGMPPQLCCPRCDAPAAGLLCGRELHIAGVRWHEDVKHAVPVPVPEEG
ncbi:hydrogenase maturation nickel metallochaperone HypA [Streptomyces sp. RB6PN25]|uniref:Hydrogenase maturation factor HypA n=1 Tax=Streptomyces humicola TaxID=2953240 RepID=A0ABT1PQD7_9ACTN|nr:hydrogenase maturation nickel metallochaperone HypA [Streptomyces humicola]MCQ4079343.1 hydrogenase maturation nickel metallochaperone HypA [Streptomyces humicola]